MICKQNMKKFALGDKGDCILLIEMQLLIGCWIEMETPLKAVPMAEC
jgi:hypothetical protein